MEPQSTNTKSGTRPLFIGCGIIALVVFFAVVVLIIWLFIGNEGGVRMSNEMEEYALAYIEEHDILNDTESIIAYYDVTISLDGSEAAILTTERVMYYKKGRTTSIDLKNIDDVKHRYETLIGDILEISSTSGTIIKIEIAPLNLGESFYNALMDTWKIGAES
ncbi:MAG: PH domain-containing protein [Deltaproteobacteria bacterium]|nr:PH domain-containing protein [Deltaproteobacteria bacterium]